ncbi:MAG: hypothetical protein JWQ38_3393 [Flavipsychrobacter sp.]|nr:hypothetical protein [Flavipsychrobacter sp.]
MNSPFANIFLATQHRIQTEVTDIKYIDQDLGQLKAKVRPPVSWPCVLIDFEDFSFENLSENVQTATGTIVLRLGFEPHSNSSQATPLPYIEQAIAYYDIEWALHKAIQGWAPGTELGSYSRISTTTQTRTDSYRVREIRYSIAFEDYSTKHQQLFAPAALSMSEQILIP